jgi:hypothetical protein
MCQGLLITLTILPRFQSRKLRRMGWNGLANRGPFLEASVAQALTTHPTYPKLCVGSTGLPQMGEGKVGKTILMGG